MNRYLINKIHYFTELHVSLISYASWKPLRNFLEKKTRSSPLYEASKTDMLSLFWYNINIISPSLNIILMNTFAYFEVKTFQNWAIHNLRRCRYQRYHIDIILHMYTPEAIMSSLICFWHFFIFYWYWQYCITLYHIITENTII